MVIKATVAVAVATVVAVEVTVALVQWEGLGEMPRRTRVPSPWHLITGFLFTLPGQRCAPEAQTSLAMLPPSLLAMLPGRLQVEEHPLHPLVHWMAAGQARAQFTSPVCVADFSLLTY